MVKIKKVVVKHTVEKEEQDWVVVGFLTFISFFAGLACGTLFYFMDVIEKVVYVEISNVFLISVFITAVVAIICYMYMNRPMKS